MNEQSVDITLAWLAGILEGDGTVALSKQRMGKDRIIYTPLVSLTNTDHSLVERVGKIYSDLEVGHYFTSKKTKNGIAKVITVKGFKRVKKLLPYLIRNMYGKKKLQAIHLSNWIKSRESTGNNKTYTEYESQLFEEIKRLKKPDHII